MTGVHLLEDSRRAAPPTKLKVKRGLYPGKGLHLVKGGIFSKAFPQGDLRLKEGKGGEAGVGAMAGQTAI